MSESKRGRVRRSNGDCTETTSTLEHVGHGHPCVGCHIVEQGHQESNLDPSSGENGAPTSPDGHHRAFKCIQNIVRSVHLHGNIYIILNTNSFGSVYIWFLAALAMRKSKRSCSSAEFPDPQVTARNWCLLTRWWSFSALEHVGHDRPCVVVYSKQVQHFAIIILI
jgi:hypothetical protein